MTRLKDLAMTYPRYGYLLLHGLLKREGLVVNKKRTYRLYTEQGLQVRGKPEAIVCDNDPEYTGKALFFWSKMHQVQLNFIQSDWWVLVCAFRYLSQQ